MPYQSRHLGLSLTKCFRTGTEARIYPAWVSLPLFFSLDTVLDYFSADILFSLKPQVTRPVLDFLLYNDRQQLTHSLYQYSANIAFKYTQSLQRNMSGTWNVFFWILSGGKGPSRLPPTIFDHPVKEHTLLHFPIELLDLPIELLQHIFSCLPLPNQVCLALSSKGLYALFNSVLRAPELRFPTMPRDGESYVTSEECYLRTTLLTQLEDSHWAFCVRCQKLHPRQEFPELFLGLKKSCTISAGIVDICPCIALTLRDRTRIVEYLRSRGPANSKRILNSIRNGSLVLNEDKDGLYLLHTCHAYQNIRAEFKLSVTESDQLISCDRYQTLPAAVATDMNAVPVCCNKNLFSCFSNPIANCSLCHARTIALTSINANVRVAQVTRYLGRDKGVIDHESADPEEE